MSRFSQYDTDEERLPEGVTRTGYDADTQTYSYRDSEGNHWEGAPGNRYGRLTQGSHGAESEPFVPGTPPRRWEHEKESWRQSWAPLLNFFVLIGLFLCGVVWLLYRHKAPVEQLDCGIGQAEYRIAKGDTCWAIAEDKGTSVEGLLGINTYSYRDSEGNDWEGAPGNRYGRLTQGSHGAESEPFVPGTPRRWQHEKESWRQSWAPLLNFFVLIGLFLCSVVWLLYRNKAPVEKLDCGIGQAEYRIAKGDTCWAIAEDKGTSVEGLPGINVGLDCDKLRIGRTICVPLKGQHVG
ncbi:hypothetical protein BN1723_008322 [Verticillium longisporum]|uniref:LysM domain-containing protein n=1 Tax=Verticillium longisporum TaxID=100787 RepID=A0A0G4NR86_VERLO|nr:hypothetical protein BN1723_008322 [Verticillium longisporum]